MSFPNPIGAPRCESQPVPVRKLARDNHTGSEPHRPGGDDLPEVLSGSLIVRGTGLAEVTATGNSSEIGKIGRSLAIMETEPPPRLQAQTRHLVRLFAIVGGAVSVLAVLLYGIMPGGWLDAVLAGIALGMSLLPEELPVVLTVFMAMGACRRVRPLAMDQTRATSQR
jgi:Ca2+-transporting ATPase